MYISTSFLFIVFSATYCKASFTPRGTASPSDIIASLALASSTQLPFPTATLPASQANDFIISSWSLNNDNVQNQPSDIAFVADPFPSASASSTTPSPVFQVTYPAHSFDSKGGSQFYSLFQNGTGASETMLLAYDVAFDSSFSWVKGGKLPGLRGGSDSAGCEGGEQANGTDCFSARLMWRSNGQGEVYAYIPDPGNLCSENDIVCNSDYGTSIGRGSFAFVSGGWNRMTLLLQLNSPADVANGNMQLFFNDVLVVDKQGLQIRSSDNVLIGGLFFSTFFGGNDKSWAPATDQHTYFRNFNLWSSPQPSNGTGITVNGQTGRAYRLHGHPGEARWWWEVAVVAVAAMLCGVGLI